MTDQPQSPPQPTPEQQHKLEAAWVLWYDSSTAAPVSRSNAVTGWITNLKRIARFTTIEEFWGVMNSVPPASSVSQGSNYFLFKEVLAPSLPRFSTFLVACY
jgi:translation initiation factor 4E